jgi:NH3-dependent NAD+ synthetase
MSIAKYEKIVDRLVAKMKLSQVPVPGFIMGLSGTDSIIAFLIVYDAASRMGVADRVVGVHYINSETSLSWFELAVMSWLWSKCPCSDLVLAVPRGGNRDPQRWADLHLRANNKVDNDLDKVIPYETGMNYWTVGTMNATEKALGRYSLLSTSVSVQPIQSLWKSEVTALCHAFDVPHEAVRRARLPDCLCGREELAAENIELIDKILRYESVSDYDSDLVEQVMTYIKSEKQSNGFRERVPYVV